MTVPEWIGAFFQTRSVAVQFGYWLARERAGNPVVFGDIDFDLGDFDIEAVDEPGPEPGSEAGPTGPSPEQDDPS
jgi:hypothetical protein